MTLAITSSARNSSPCTARQSRCPTAAKTRVVIVDIDPDSLYARSMSPQDVTNAIFSQNIIVPPGTAKMGSIEYDVAINSSPELLEQLNEIPIRYANG